MLGAESGLRANQFGTAGSKAHGNRGSTTGATEVAQALPENPGTI